MSGSKVTQPVGGSVGLFFGKVNFKCSVVPSTRFYDWAGHRQTDQKCKSNPLVNSVWYLPDGISWSVPVSCDPSEI